MKPFLTAEWRDLVLLTYAIDPSLLAPFLPKGVIADTRDGHAFVSFVAFDFLKTRVKGLPIPFHVNFPEINLRYYVRYKEKRGVMFVKELVPKYCIALVADRLYNEPYESTPMSSNVNVADGLREIKHQFNYCGQNFDLHFTVKDQPFLPPENSTEHFFKEHEWGFNLDKKGRLLKYQVTHPFWRIYPIESRFKFNIDFQAIYGEHWEVLNGKIPYSVVVAEGSPIKVYPGQIIG